MSKRITFFIASNTGSQMRRVTISRFILGLFIGCFVILFLVSGYLLNDYYHLKVSFFHNKGLKEKVVSQRREIEEQRKQIQAFAEDINKMKLNLVSINNFERKVRIIANIEKTIDQNAIFGVGGEMPDDLDPKIALSDRHASLLRDMHEQVGQLEDASNHQKKSFGFLIKYLGKQKNILASTPAIIPTRGWITSKFGYRTSPFTGLREFHKGLDIATRKGTKVIASANGIVTFSGRKGLLGNAIIISHGHGMVTRYGHLSKCIKKRGDKVKRGDVIGLVGNTGRSTGPHLHYDVRLNGISVNPEKYILN